MDRVRDRLGMPVDTGIRDTVVVLNLHGLHTLQSCEGHVNACGHGLPAPWVDLVDDPTVLAEVHSLLGAFYDSNTPTDDDARLRLTGSRIANGGGYGALMSARAALAQDALDGAEVDDLRAKLAVRQAEMRRFTAFLTQRLRMSTAA